MAPVDIAIVLAFVVGTLISGLRNRRVASQNLEEYFLAGRSLPGWRAGLSMAATQFAADTPLLVTGLIATAGIFALWQLWIYALAFLLMGFVLSSGWRRAGVLTDAELTELRYGHAPAAVLRAVKAVYFGTVLNCTVLAWVLFATASIAEPFLRWDQWLSPELLQPLVSLVAWVGVPLTALGADHPAVWLTTANNLLSLGAILTLVGFYSTTGGLRSVVTTDIGQLAVMLIGTLIFTTIVVGEVGGLSALPARLGELFAGGGVGGIRPHEILAFTPGHAKDASATVLGLYGLLWLVQLNSDGSGPLAQRTMACRSDADARTAAVVFTYTQVVLRSLLWLPLGLGLLVIFPPDPTLSSALQQAERETSYVRGMAELLPPGVLGLMLAGMLAAVASTVDTHLNWGASYWTNDIYKRFLCQAWLGIEPSDRSLVWVARGANLLIVVLALLIMTQLRSINQAWQTSLLMGAGMGIVLLLRWIWWRVNAWAEIGAALVSVVAAPILMTSLGDDQQPARLLIMAVCSTAGALVAMHLGGPETPDRLTAFYRKVRPPGYWGPVAAAVGDAPRQVAWRLWRGLAATGCCALSVFCLLVGVGTWLTGAPAPSWFPWRPAWVAVLLVTALFLTPVWRALATPGKTNDPGAETTRPA